MVQAASGNHLNRAQAARTWDRTIHPLDKRLGLLTGYVKPQEGTSKRTAAGSVEHQKQWHDQCDQLFTKVKQRVHEVLNNDELVQTMLPYLIANLD